MLEIILQQSQHHTHCKMLTKIFRGVVKIKEKLRLIASQKALYFHNFRTMLIVK